jgi:hypothetical protein
MVDDIYLHLCSDLLYVVFDSSGRKAPESRFWPFER